MHDTQQTHRPRPQPFFSNKIQQQRNLRSARNALPRTSAAFESLGVGSDVLKSVSHCPIAHRLNLRVRFDIERKMNGLFDGSAWMRFLPREKPDDMNAVKENKDERKVHPKPYFCEHHAHGTKNGQCDTIQLLLGRGSKAYASHGQNGTQPEWDTTAEWGERACLLESEIIDALLVDETKHLVRMLGKRHPDVDALVVVKFVGLLLTRAISIVDRLSQVRAGDVGPLIGSGTAPLHLLGSEGREGGSGQNPREKQGRTTGNEQRGTGV